MTRRLLVAASLLAAIVAIAAPATAQPPVASTHLISVGLGGGVSVPVSDAKDVFEHGYNGMGFVRLNLPFLPITPRVDFTYNRFDIKSSALSGLGSPVTSGTSTSMAGVANVQIPLMHAPLVTPYLIAGLGAYNVKTELDDVNNTSDSATHFGINGGAGLIVKLGMVSLSAEGRRDNVYTDKGLIDSKSIQTVPVSFGLVY